MNGRHHIPALLAVLAVLALWPRVAGAEELVADISDREVAITSSFSGQDLLIFGYAGADLANLQADVIVTVTGPTATTTVRRKERTAGIWLNRTSVTFTGVPQYYAIASTRALGDIGAPDLFATHRIGFANLPMRPARGETDDAATITTFRDALISSKLAGGLFMAFDRGVTPVRSGLFRASFTLPANVPIGAYKVDVYLIRDGRLIGGQARPLYVRKTGLERTLYDFAQNQPLGYGIAAIVIACVAGWLAAAAFRRR